MIPTLNLLTEEITEAQYPSRTYKINIVPTKGEAENTANLGKAILGKMSLGVYESTSVGSSDFDGRISGYVDDVDAVKQAIYLILNTERYKHLIYSWDYGVELLDLFGKPMPYVMSELPRRIKEALTQDNRIDDVKDFEFEQHGNKLHTTFTVVSNVGNIPTELEVEV